MFLFWVIICIEIDTVQERDRDRGRAEDCDANVNGDSDVDSLTELERQFRFQLWPTIRDTVKYSGDNNETTTTKTTIAVQFFYFYFGFASSSCTSSSCCSFSVQSCTRSFDRATFGSLRLDERTSTDRPTTATAWLQLEESDDDDDCACFQASFCFASLLLLLLLSLPMLSSSQCSLNSRSLAKSCLRHMLLLLLFLLFANFGFDYACSLGASLFDTCCYCCFVFLQTSALASPALSSLHCTLSVSHTLIMQWVSWQCSL